MRLSRLGTPGACVLFSDEAWKRVIVQLCGWAVWGARSLGQWRAGHASVGGRAGEPAPSRSPSGSTLDRSTPRASVSRGRTFSRLAERHSGVRGLLPGV